MAGSITVSNLGPTGPTGPAGSGSNGALFTGIVTMNDFSSNLVTVTNLTESAIILITPFYISSSSQPTITTNYYVRITTSGGSFNVVNTTAANGERVALQYSHCNKINIIKIQIFLLFINIIKSHPKSHLDNPYLLKPSLLLEFERFHSLIYRCIS